MNKSATLITTALLTMGFAAGSMAADAPKSTAAMAADPAASSTPAPAAKSHKHSKKKKSTPATAPATTK